MRHTRNALGQVTAITTQLDGGAEQPTVSAARYYPNGALAQFTYGNGIVHTMTQNARQLPARSTDGAVLDLGLAYDAAGNVVEIADGTAGGRQTRSLGYDGLDRLVTATSPMFGAAAYAYDVQDNLMRVQVTGGGQPRDHYYCYNARKQLEFVRSGPDCNGSPAVVALGYDAQGNLAFKNGRTYTFDAGNRLRSVAGQGYRYDAQGRRVRSDAGGAQRRYSFYAQDGRLLWQRDEVAGTRSVNVYLAGSLVAEYRRPLSGTSASVSFLHTDPLGSPIAKTDAAGAVVETSEYEPYGLLLNRANDDRAGYTGHVMDSASGLTYMQQRYYDPQIGRFLSVDPVTANSVNGSNFNRYWYANNNPYRFTDPDGRLANDRSKPCGLESCPEPEKPKPEQPKPEQPKPQPKPQDQKPAEQQLTYWQRVKERWLQTRSEIPGTFTVPGTTMATASTTSKSVGGVTVKEAYKYLKANPTTLYRGQIIGSAAVTTAINFVAISGAWEGGLVIGSMIYEAPLPGNTTVSQELGRGIDTVFGSP